VSLHLLSEDEEVTDEIAVFSQQYSQPQYAQPPPQQSYAPPSNAYAPQQQDPYAPPPVGQANGNYQMQPMNTSGVPQPGGDLSPFFAEVSF